MGGPATGEIEFDGARDWFAVTLEAGKAYRFELEGFRDHAGTLRNPYLRGIHDADGTLIDDAANDDLGWWNRNSQVTFTPSADGTHYVAAGACRYDVGTYQVSVTEDGDGK